MKVTYSEIVKTIESNIHLANQKTYPGMILGTPVATGTPSELVTQFIEIVESLGGKMIDRGHSGALVEMKTSDGKKTISFNVNEIQEIGSLQVMVKV